MTENKDRIENTKAKILVDFNLLDCYKIVIEDLMKQAYKMNRKECADMAQKLIEVCELTKG